MLQIQDTEQVVLYIVQIPFNTYPKCLGHNDRQQQCTDTFENNCINEPGPGCSKAD